MERFALYLVRPLVRMVGTWIVGSRIHATDCPLGYHYKWVLRHETRQVPYTVSETHYDHRGQQTYEVQVTRYRTKRVSVWRQIAVLNRH